MKYVLAVLPMPALLVLLSRLVQTVSDMAPSPTTGCPSMCGDVQIPYPFGIGYDCAWRGLDNFTVSCNHSSNPPRPYTGDFEIIDISLESGEVRVFAPVSHICCNSSDTTESGIAWRVNLTGWPFLISPERNEFVAIGCNTLPLLEGRDNLTGCITTCTSLDGAASDGDPCTGLGCCQTPSIPGNLSTIAVDWSSQPVNNPAWSYSPCSYAFVAAKGWYKFSRRHLILNNTGDMAFGTPIPLVLDWAIKRNGTCPPPPAKQVAPACVSAHSRCVSAMDGQGYLCNCSEGYTGNPYVAGGCTNINECELRQSDPTRYEKQYACQSGSRCRDTDGGYECECDFGRRGDGKSGEGCRPLFPAHAVAIVAAASAVVLLGVLLWFIHSEHKRRQLRGFFDKNGGHILKTMNITIFKKEQLDMITNNYSSIIGKGNFGEVFMGIVDNQRVAVKRSIAVNSQDDFANEITIQLQMSHKNLVRLVGCCLETDVPMLVFEFIPNGSLYSVLHGTEKHTLSLPIRLNIAIGSAEALAYMHSHASHKILHGDVKSGNILLDDNFHPKVSDFGTSKLLSLEKKYTGFVIGDRGYIDPVYMTTGLLTEKSDVYSFGVVLLELVTGKEPRYNRNGSLPLDFKKSYLTGTSRAREMLDDKFTSAEDIDCLEKIGAIAVECLREYVDERPTMAQVVDGLKLVKLPKLASEIKRNTLSEREKQVRRAASLPAARHNRPGTTGEVAATKKMK